MLRRLTSEKVARTFYTDEKIFTVEPPINTQNNRVYAPRNKLNADIADDRLFVTRSHSSKSIMVFVGVSKLRKTTLHFVNPGAKVNGEYYRNKKVKLLGMMLPEIRILAEGGHFIFQQDGARAHTTKYTIAYPKVNVPEFIKPENWPPNSPDLNPVDYSIWENIKGLGMCNT